ncbi:MAG: hypothetical protein HY331_16375 [Chloroflexi bacterium]|nr:hypothetical protein [Chloroflexota bacterium]
MIIQRLTLILLVLALALAGAGAVPPAGAEGEITVVSSNQQIDFPNEILFTLKARSQRPITKITLNYALGRGKSTAYGYPSFQPGTDVLADFSLKTGGGKHLPPFANVRFSYTVEDDQGRQFTTPSQVILYEDSRFTWSKLGRGLATVYYYGNARAQAERVLQTALSTLDRMSKQAGVTAEDPVRVVLYNTKEDMDRAIPFVSQTTRRELITLGQAFNDYDVVLVLGRGDAGEVIAVTAHELTHLITHQATDSPFVDLPAWFNEGLSVYGESSLGSGHGYEGALQQAIDQNRVPPLRWQADLPGKPQDTILLYGVGHSVVRYLIDRHGPEKMRAFLATMKSGKAFEAALQQTYGFDLNTLDNDWRQSIGLKPLPTPAASGARGPQAVPTLVPFGAQTPAGQPAPAASVPSAAVPAASPQPPTAPAVTPEASAWTPSPLLIAAGGLVALFLVIGVVASIAARRGG